MSTNIEEQVILLQKQIEISSPEAKQLLNMHDGNILNSVLDFYNYDEKKEVPYKNADDDNPHKILYELRQISDEKDIILQELLVSKKNEKTNSDNSNLNKK